MRADLLHQPLLCTLVSAISLLGIARVALAQEASRLENAFRRIDQNGDQQLSTDELSRFPQLINRLRGADENGDETINFGEFQAQLVRRALATDPRNGNLEVENWVREVTVGASRRRYRVHLPESYDPERANPVVIVFHGGGGNPDSMVRISGLDEKADEAGFIVVYPYGSGRDPNRSLTFNAGSVGGYAKQHGIDDVEFTRALIEDLGTAVNLDQERVYATGFSNGAMMAYRVASELSDLIAAIAPVAGPMGMDTCKPTRPVSVLHFHGTADALAPFEGGKGKGTSNVPSFLRPEFRSVAFSLDKWVEANGCDQEPKVEKLPDRADDGMTVIRKTWGNGREDSEVVLVEIRGGGHTWPGNKPPVALLGESTEDISANDLMWEFFLKHPQKPAEKLAPEAPEPGSPKATDAAWDATGRRQPFESIHTPSLHQFPRGA